VEEPVTLNKEFYPHPDFQKLYYIYVALSSVLLYLSWTVPLTIFIHINEPVLFIMVTLGLFLPFVGIVAFVALWIPKYYSSIRYLFSESEMTVDMGVWWKHKSIVPYNRVTNIDVVQGPLSRRFGLGRVSIQTAGSSAGGAGSSHKVAEAVILGVKNSDEVKDFVLARVKRLRPMAVEAGVPEVEDSGLRILDELRKIRGILQEEKQT